ncbi:hypothetical protein [Gimesia maris]|uniref:DNA-binding protein n=1 Tax=Gimesia maris TaxID=122 RepID=A0ABX5YPH4_9PLAN|nr:hypothetical protein [Gimesia maris]EDL58368.1 hypothetical protein PM8797T_26970 [Gimesia maris DSM 8797]QEG17537.1 hypothetical protein GmarT_34190 [Gimesia maris]QGQ29399.1 hypothetical protein F1729_12425 [Gimesia maris]
MSKGTGQIEPDTLYSLDQFKQVSGMGNWALREARKAGLKMLKIGNRKYVKGQSFIDFLESVNETSTTMGA